MTAITPKEEALILINGLNLIVLDTALGGSNRRVKQCALFMVRRIQTLVSIDEIDHWINVEEELNKL